MKTQDRQSLVASPPLSEPARKDSAACVSLSSNHNVKEPVGVKRMPHSRTPDGSKSPIWSQRQSKRPSRRPEKAPPLSERITRSRLVPQVLRATRAKCVDKCRRFRCQEARPTNPGGPLPRRFLGDRDRQATFLPECASTLYPLTAR